MTEKALAEQMIDDEQIDRNKLAATRGWLADPPPLPPRAYIPGEENKWFLMMGARDALERKRKRERRGDVR